MQRATEPLQLDQTANGRVVAVHRGQTLTVTLPSNPSTGYSWRVAANGLPGMLAQRGDPVFVAPADEVRVGVPGMQAFTFAVVEAGRGTLRLEYVRPWRPQEVALEFTLETEVVR